MAGPSFVAWGEPERMVAHGKRTLRVMEALAAIARREANGHHEWTTAVYGAG